MMKSWSEHDEETVTELTSDALKMFSWVRGWGRRGDRLVDPGRNLIAYSGANRAKRGPESQGKTTLGAAGRMRR
ncbi:unnamed protein product [Arctogadus glacialis]